MRADLDVRSVDEGGGKGREEASEAVEGVGRIERLLTDAED